MDFPRQPGENNHADLNVELAPDAKSGAWRGAPQQTPPVAPARTLLGALGRTARFDGALAMSTPVVAATAAAWWQNGTINVLAALFMVAGAFFAALGINLLIEYYDRLRAQDPQVQAAL